MNEVTTIWRYTNVYIIIIIIIPKGMCSGSHDLVKFWEIRSDNILETVQNMVAMEV